MKLHVPVMRVSDVRMTRLISFCALKVHRQFKNRMVWEEGNGMEIPSDMRSLGESKGKVEKEKVKWDKTNEV